MQQRNKDLPASAVHPIQDKFGQVILMTGFTKQEAVALEIFKAHVMNNTDWADDPVNELTIKYCYELAEKFCAYLENEGEKEGGLIQSV